MPGTALDIRKTTTIKKATESAIQVLTVQSGIQTYQLTLHSVVRGLFCFSRADTKGGRLLKKWQRLRSSVRKSFSMTMHSFNYIYSAAMYRGSIVG